jgi:hypothetical protein
MSNKVKFIAIFASVSLAILGVLSLVLFSFANAPLWFNIATTKIEHPAAADYQSLNKLLALVVKDGKVDYKQAKLAPEMNLALDYFAHTSPDKFKDEAEKLCYWINAHNLVILKVVADRYPIKSAKLLSRDIDARRFNLGGEAHSAEEIWLKKIRPYPLSDELGLLHDSRIIMLVSNGAAGDPPVLDHAVIPSLLSKDMAANTYKFIHNPRNVTYSLERSVFGISPYFQWNSLIIEKHFGTPHNFVLYYLEMPNKIPNRVGLMETYNRVFDWRVNDLES